MSLTRIASVSALVCVMMAGAVQADSRQDRGKKRGRAGRVVVHPRIVVRPQAVRVAPFGHRYRPVYRPGLGVGIYIGAPHRYRYPAYGRRLPAPHTYAYGLPYPIQAGIYAVPPPVALYGGVRLDVTPRDAAVYVDGYYAGVVDDFDGVLQRVALEPGPHDFEIAAPGHQSLAFAVNVRPNQTVRYRGDLERIVP